MKSILFAIIILQSVICFAQTNKDSLAKHDRDSLRNNKSIIEKQDVPTIKMNKFLLENRIIFNAADMNYNTDFQKASFKEMINNGQKPEPNSADDNVKNLLSDLRRGMEDKRSGLQKVVQTVLGIAQTALVAGLAVREVVRKKD